MLPFSRFEFAFRNPLFVEMFELQKLIIDPEPAAMTDNELLVPDITMLLLKVMFATFVELVILMTLVLVIELIVMLSLNISNSGTLLILLFPNFTDISENSKETRDKKLNN